MLNIRKTVSLLVVLSLVLSSTACTTLKPVKVPSDDIQDRILADELLKKGDRIKIVTKDRKIHQIEVTDIKEGIIEGRTDGLAKGKDVSIPVAEVVNVSVYEISAEKTIKYTVLVLAATFGFLISVFFAAHL